MGRWVEKHSEILWNATKDSRTPLKVGEVVLRYLFWVMGVDNVNGILSLAVEAKLTKLTKLTWG